MSLRAVTEAVFPAAQAPVPAGSDAHAGGGACAGFPAFAGQFPLASAAPAGTVTAAVLSAGPAAAFFSGDVFLRFFFGGAGGCAAIHAS